MALWTKPEKSAQDPVILLWPSGAREHFSFQKLLEAAASGPWTAVGELDPPIQLPLRSTLDHSAGRWHSVSVMLLADADDKRRLYQWVALFHQPG